MNQLLDELILNNTLLRVLEHFRIAKVDYAKNVTKYTEIQRDTVLSCIHELEQHGLLEKYTNTSIKRTAAKLKKSAEVHKHHTYFQITRDGVAALNNINPASYVEFLADDCIQCLMNRGKERLMEGKAAKMIRMGLMTRNSELTGLGIQVLEELKKEKYHKF